MKNKKEMIKKLLEKLSEEDILEIIGEDEEEVEESSYNKAFHQIKSSQRSSTRSSKGRKDRSKKSKKTGRRGDEEDKNFCRREPIQVGNYVNRFDEIIKKVKLSAAEKKELEAADKIDDSKITAREKRQSTLVEVECRVCGKEQEVSASLVSNKSRWKCNKCSTGGY